MKIVSSGKVLNSRKFYEKKKRRSRAQIILFSLLIVSAIGASVYFSRQQNFQIIGAEVFGENVVDREEMVKKAQQLLNGYYLWLIPRSNTLLYPKGAIEKSLLTSFSRLKSVSLNLDESKKLNIKVEERIPFALFCDDVSQQEESSNCYFLDSDGFIFVLAPSFSHGVYFVYTEKMTENPIGQWFISKEEFKLLQSFIKRLEIINIVAAKFDSTGDEYALILTNRAKIIWKKEEDLNKVYSNLEAFLSSEATRSQADFLDKILYLDLRSDNKVFYKFRN